MDHPFEMSIVQSLGGLTDVLAGRRDRQGAASAHELMQSWTGNVFHDEISPLSLLIGVKSRDDVRVDQATGGPNLALEEFLRPRRLEQARGQDLDGDEATERAMLGLEDT